MMWCTPEHAVFYGGVLHPTGKRFEIKPEDADEMRTHGTVETLEERIATAEAEIRGTSEFIEMPDDKSKRGRLKRNEM